MGIFCPIAPEKVSMFKKRVCIFLNINKTRFQITSEDIFVDCASGLQHTTTGFVCSDAVLSSPSSLPLLRGPAFCSQVLFVSHSRLSCGLPTARPLLLPPSFISYCSFLCWIKAQRFWAWIMWISLCFWKRSRLLTWRQKSPFSLFHPGERQPRLLFYLLALWIIQDNLAVLQSVGENDKLYYKPGCSQKPDE